MANVRTMKIAAAALMSMMLMMMISVSSAQDEANNEDAEELLNEIIKYGLDQSDILERVHEKKLYESGIRLNKTNPAHFVAVFNKQKERTKLLSHFGYASLEASSLLARQYV